MKVLLAALLAFCILACNNESANDVSAKDSMVGTTLHSNATDTIITNAKPLQLSGCYEMVFKKDSAHLVLEVKDTTVTGTLVFNFAQKDKNRGTIKGVLRNNMIYADYTFHSEGMTSVREVVFKIEDDNLVQAFGDITEKGGKLIFTDKEHLQFQTANPFIKTDCP
jgi:hypothetical protein